MLAGKYRVDRVLGAGAMGVVVQAQHLSLDSRVAIKLLLPSMLANEDAVARFAREARAVARLTNEHVARVFDVGTLDTGAPFMVMEFLEGADMHKWLQNQPPLSVELAVDLLLQVCEAVRDAHERGIVHRDLKPANLFCVRRSEGRPFVKVLDFGISKLVSTGDEDSAVAMTRTGAIMGTPLYMAPEQMNSSRDVDARADIWALGCIFYELLARRVPFLGSSLPEVCLKVISEPVPSLRQARPDIPDAIEATILKCLEKDRNRRFGTVADLQAAIGPFAQGPASGWNPLAYAPRASGTMAADVPEIGSRLGASSGAERSLGPVGNTRPSEPRRPGARALVVTGGIVVAGLAVTLALALTRTTKSTSPSSESATAAASVSTTQAGPTFAPLPPLVAAPSPLPSTTGDGNAPGPVLADGGVPMAASARTKLDRFTPTPHLPAVVQHARPAASAAAAPANAPSPEPAEVDHGF